MDRMSTSALRKIRRHKPTSLAAFKKLFKLKWVGAGVFREVYEITGSGFVVKFPILEKYSEYIEGIHHSRAEVKRIARLNTLHILRPHLPKIHYYDSKTGIVVMEKYAIASADYVVQFELLGKVVQKLIKKLIGVNFSDIHAGNVGYVKPTRKRRGRIVFLDLGY